MKKNLRVILSPTLQCIPPGLRVLGEIPVNTV
jgi:hypothetical protein